MAVTLNQSQNQMKSRGQDVNKASKTERRHTGNGIF